jgi:hypothetical protein
LQEINPARDQQQKTRTSQQHPQQEAGICFLLAPPGFLPPARALFVELLILFIVLTASAGRWGIVLIRVPSSAPGAIVRFFLSYLFGLVNHSGQEPRLALGAGDLLPGG